MKKKKKNPSERDTESDEPREYNNEKMMIFHMG